MNETLIYCGAWIIILWGIAHIIPTRTIVKSFGAISDDNKKILTMEIISEGLTLIFLGMLPLVLTLYVDSVGTPARIVYLSEGGMLLAMALVTLFTGARTPTIWYKICPVVKIVVAVLYILGAVL
jgi:energy-converting hydrogenase Eha subunit E